MAERRIIRTPKSEQSVIGLSVEIRRYRVLFSDGEVVDFLASNDNSNNRGRMLEHHFGKIAQKVTDKRIEGITDLGAVYSHEPEWP